MSELWYGILIVAVIVLISIVFFMTRYRLSPPDRALIITGKLLGKKNNFIDSSGNRFKIVRGGGVMVLPILQTAKKISISSNKVVVNAENLFSKNNIPMVLRAVALVKVGSSLRAISLTAENYLSKSTEEMCEDVNEIIKYQLSVILKKMNAEDMQTDIQVIEKELISSVNGEIDKFGLELLTFSIMEIYDEKGYLATLNEQEVIRVKTETEQLLILSELETEQLRMQAEKEKEIARINRKLVAEEAKTKETLKLSTLKDEQDRAKARAESAYESEKSETEYEIAIKKAEMEKKRLENSYDLDMLTAERRSAIYNVETRKKADTQVYVKQRETESHRENLKMRTESEIEKLLQLTKVEAEIKAIEAETIDKYGDTVKELYKFDKYLKAMEKADSPSNYAEKLFSNKELMNLDVLKELEGHSEEAMNQVIKNLTSKVNDLKRDSELTP